MQKEILSRLDRYLEGRQVSYNERTIPMMPLENIKPGRAVVKSDVDDQGLSCRMPLVNQMDISLSADMVTSNVFSGELKAIKLDGTTAFVTTVVLTLADNDHDAAMTLLEAKFASLTDVTADLTDATNNRKITLDIGKDKKLVNSTAFGITGGATQPTVTTTKGTNDKVVGISTTAGKGQDAAGDVVWEKNKEMMPVMRHGDLAVRVNQAVAWGNDVFALFDDDGADERGTFRKDDNSGAAPAVKVNNAAFRDKAADLELAPVELTNP